MLTPPRANNTRSTLEPFNMQREAGFSFGSPIPPTPPAPRKLRATVTRFVPKMNPLKESLQIEGEVVVQRPGYATERERLASFRGHEDKFVVNIDLLAQAGWIFNGGDDNTTQCFSCLVKVCNWNLLDDAFWEHKLWSPDCEYLKAVEKAHPKLAQHIERGVYYMNRS